MGWNTVYIFGSTKSIHCWMLIFNFLVQWHTFLLVHRIGFAATNRIITTITTFTGFSKRPTKTKTEILTMLTHFLVWKFVWLKTIFENRAIATNININISNNNNNGQYIEPANALQQNESLYKADFGSLEMWLKVLESNLIYRCTQCANCLVDIKQFVYMESMIWLNHI